MSTSLQLQRRITSLQILQDAYPKQLLISFSEAVSWLGICVGTARNWASAGTFPIPTQKLGDLRQVDIRDLADYLDGASTGGEPQMLASTSEKDIRGPNKRGRGRPKKMDAATRRPAGATNIARATEKRGGGA